MKRTLALLAVVVIALALWPQTASAQDKVIPFTAVEISCSETPGAETTEGDITRHRGQIEDVVWFSEEPLANGRLAEVINWNYYASIDQGNYTGTYCLGAAGHGWRIRRRVQRLLGRKRRIVHRFWRSAMVRLTGMEFLMTGAPMTDGCRHVADQG